MDMLGIDAKKRYKSGFRLIIGAGAIAVAGIGGYFAYLTFFSADTSAISVQAMEVERGEVIKSVQSGGIVKLGNQQSLKAPTTANRSAIVESIEVSVNSPIQEGQVLVTLKDPEGQTQVNEQRLNIQKQQLVLEEKQRAVIRAEAALKQARTELQIQQENTTEIRKMEAERDRAQAKIQEQEIELENLQEELESIRDLVERGFLAETEQRSQEQQVRRAEASLRDNENALQQAELNLTNQRLIYQQTLQAKQEVFIQREIELKNARSAVQTALRDLENTQLSLIKTEENFQKNSLIKATTTGRVLDIDVKPGDVLKQDQILLTIGDPRREEVEIRLPTLQAALVQLNQPAKVEAIGLISGTFPGRVKELSKVALDSTETSSRFSSSQSTVKAIVVLDEPSRKMIPGSQVSVKIIIDRAENALSLPPQFIQDRDSEDPYVWVIDEDKMAEKRPVELGLVGDTAIAITSGLEAGELVTSPPADRPLEAGMKLLPTEEEPPEEEGE